jgi:hypothetical protein
VRSSPRGLGGLSAVTEDAGNRCKPDPRAARSSPSSRRPPSRRSRGCRFRNSCRHSTWQLRRSRCRPTSGTHRPKLRPLCSFIMAARFYLQLVEPPSLEIQRTIRGSPIVSFMNPQRRRRTCPQFLIGAPVGPSRAAPTHRYGARMSGSLIDGEDVEVLVVPLPRVGLTPPTRSYAALRPVAPRPSIRPAPRLSRERTGLAAAGAQSPHMACTARTCENQLDATERG